MPAVDIEASPNRSRGGYQRVQTFEDQVSPDPRLPMIAKCVGNAA